MKLQSILLLTGIAAGFLTVSCKSTADEAEEFFGRSAPDKAKAEAQDAALVDDYYNKVNAHIDRRLNEFNEKEEAKLPIFSSKEIQEDFQDLSFIRNAQQISLLSMDFTASGETKIKLIFDRDSRSFTRIIGDKTEKYTFETFTNGVPPTIPYDIHILYAFAADFNRIAETISIRGYEKLEKGENPAIADLENEANLDENGKKKNKNFVEVKPKVTFEPIEFRVDNRWCKCYDVKLKKTCAPAVSMALYVSNEEKTISRADIIFDDDSKVAFIMDWREQQDGIVLPRVIRRINGKTTDVFFRDDAKVILISDRAAAEADAAAEAREKEVQERAEKTAFQEDEMVEFDASSTDAAEEEDSAEDEEPAADEEPVEDEDSAADEEPAADEDSAEAEEPAEDEDSAEAEEPEEDEDSEEEEEDLFEDEEDLEEE